MSRMGHTKVHIDSITKDRTRSTDEKNIARPNNLKKRHKVRQVQEISDTQCLVPKYGLDNNSQGLVPFGKIVINEEIVDIKRDCCASRFTDDIDEQKDPHPKNIDTSQKTRDETEGHEIWERRGPVTTPFVKRWVRGKDSLSLSILIWFCLRR